MSNDMLSQEEIDALLNGGNKDSQSDVEELLTSIEKDAIGEVGNISFGSAATALSTLLNQKVEITTPTVEVVKKEDLQNEFPKPHVAVNVSYTEGFDGSNLLVIKTTDAQIIADLMLGGDGTNPHGELGELHLSAVQEAMNQMMGSASTSMSTVFNKRVDISPPSIDLMDIHTDDGTDLIPDVDMLVKVAFKLKVGDLIDSQIMQLVPLEFGKDLVDQLMNPEQNTEAAVEVNQVERQEEKQQPATPAASPHREAQPQVNSQPPARREEHREQPTYQNTRNENVHPAAFSDFSSHEPVSVDQRNLDMLLDIPLQVTVELGRTKRSVKDILELSQGSIIELDKLAGEPVDILVNQKLIAKGEVVVIDENFGVRVTEIMSQRDRLEKLQ
ncbi:flagellar motor switch phosphatase FliY [Pseudalkalibacillus berkeleyi]|uniref:Flagellar motor switch phosphatase FliY n=1 Tax=Pseudalkalibacillus berkeleyi TaxID=1069813 RepID=A0ABS9GWD6_9BACL|nr:flagellar motor switch phosphatase FliY [Pseudalkalibacillus berkeleyi]MCF6137117.1 flagellar motor switch phosphatase FliY [Pseudalkalibacillus berkeleyi]